MNEREVIERKILLKRQAMEILQWEINLLLQELAVETDLKVEGNGAT